MTQKATDRLIVIQQLVNRQLRQREAAVQLGLSIRQVKRLVVRFRQEGPPGLVSRHLGRRPGNALSKAVRQEIMGLVHERYADMSATPTLAPRWPVRSWWSSTVTGCRSRRCDSG